MSKKLAAFRLQNRGVTERSLKSATLRRPRTWLKLDVAEPDVAAMRRGWNDEIDEDLAQLDHNITRLRIEYDQFFLGNMKRPPQVLLGKVQKTIARFSNKMPSNTAQKFRFNQLNSRYQMYRQHWGRVMRQIEAGTYKIHRFKADLHDQQRNTGESPAPKAPAGRRGNDTAIEKLCDALISARSRTGDTSSIDRSKVAQMVKQQTSAIRKQHPGARIRFRVVIEDRKAKLKASISKA